MPDRSIDASVEWIRQLQRENGQIPWFDGGHSDPWNHVEAVMALCVGGELDAAQRGLEWLSNTQLGDGSWFHYYLDHAVESARIDLNVVAYVASGVWLFRAYAGEHRAREFFPMVSRALDFVCRWASADGFIPWSLDQTGRVAREGLLTGSASLVHSLRCGVALATDWGGDGARWSTVAERLAHVVAVHPDAFADKHQFAMDWYYPVLAGVLEGERARAHLSRGWSTFVREGEGVCCVSTSPWVTAAETSECVLALAALGERESARQLYSWTLRHRLPDGSYLTGLVGEPPVSFPDGERSSYTVAAAILARAALDDTSAVVELFRVRGATPVTTCARCDVVASPVVNPR